MILKCYTKIIQDFFGQETLETLRNFVDPQTRHSHIIYSMAVGAASLEKQIENFAMAISTLLQDESSTNWLERMKPRLLQDNINNVRAAIGEVVAYAELLHADFIVKPIATSNNHPTPEYVVIDHNNNEFIVEVFSKQLCDETTRRIGTSQDLLEQISDRGPGVYFDVQEISPYGYSNDSVTEDAISKICAIKGREHQALPGKPFIIWVDIQNSGDFFLGDQDYANPITSWKGTLASGHYWYGMYGKKNLPVFNDYTIFYHQGEKKPYPMQHNGRFLLSKKISGMFFRFEKSIVFFENPNAEQKISMFTRHQLTMFRDFDLGKSMIDFADGLVKQKIEIAYAEIEALAKK
uniref:Uncharacterized protein n=1 Tax=uncultured Alphaproteobacteria bacterium TaxID=91750 RepID=A0A6G8F2R7_9PROT|nr:hypothetical protein PlAlph_3500 [uncultured Alphaproteobacteria bacterium]